MSNFLLLNWLAVGVIVGLCSKLLFSGRDAGGWIGTMMISITGAVADGWCASHLGGRASVGSLSDWLAAIVGAILMLAVYRFVIRRNLML